MDEHSLWVEKYRPKSFAEVKGQLPILEKIKAFVAAKNMPHLMFAGPAGVGKSTTALVVAHELFGEPWRDNFLELNASVTGDTPILVKINGKIKRKNFNELAQEYFQKDEKRAMIPNLEVLSIDKEYKIVFSKVNYLFRHKKEKIAKIKYEGGFVKASLDHSLIMFDNNGNLKPVMAGELKKGDLLITFKTELPGYENRIDITHLRPKLFSRLRSGLQKNPKIRNDFREFDLDLEASWALGLYVAEGCTSVHKTSAHIIYTLAYPQEICLGNRLKEVFTNKEVTTKTMVAHSGFDKTKMSSQQISIFNTQLARFLRENCYDAMAERKFAWTKRVPSFMFDSGGDQRRAFLEGYYRGDGCGSWNEVARISSVSEDCLIDAAWLGRISNIESSYFPGEVRFIWKNRKFSYVKSELLPSEIFQNFIKKAGLKKNYLLRHSLYSKKSKRIKRELAYMLLSKCKKEDELYSNIKRIAESDLSAVKITGITCEDYNDYVYDFSVPETQMFWGGTIPILLHNSDERGIDVVRTKVKDFARTRAIGNVPFKIIFLDECDALTKEAQQALRRTMENYTQTTRFILSCNYSSKIIDPIQSRCTVFRFKPLEKEEMYAIFEKIAKEEKIELEKSAKEALYICSEGDCRKAENILQSCAAVTNKVTENDIFSLASVAKPNEISEFLILALQNKFIPAREKLLDTMLKYSLSGLDIIKQIQKEVWNLPVTDQQKVQLVDKCGEIEFRMTEGADEFVQLEALLAQFTLCKK